MHTIKLAIKLYKYILFDTAKLKRLLEITKFIQILYNKLIMNKEEIIFRELKKYTKKEFTKESYIK